MKNQALFSFFKIIILALISKCLSVFIKIYQARIFDLEVLSLFALLNPLLIFLIILIEQSLPQIIIKKVTINYQNKHDILLSSLNNSLLLSLFIMIILNVFNSQIASYLLHDSSLSNAISYLSILLFLISLTSIYKGYLIGLKRLKITYLSQVFEELFRLLFIVLFANFFIKKGRNVSLCFLISGLIIGEIFQLISLLIFNYLKKLKNILKIPKKLINTSITYQTKLIKISLTLTISKLLTSFLYSLEPLIYNNILSSLNYPKNYILTSYGIMNSYVTPILFLPGFIITILSTYLLPKISKAYALKEYRNCKIIYLKGLLFSFLIGLSSALIIFIFNGKLTILLFNTTKGEEYLKILAFPYILYYLEAINISCLIGINKEKVYSFIQIFSAIIRLIFLFILIPKYLIIGIEYAIIISLLFNFIISIYYLKKYLLSI